MTCFLSIITTLLFYLSLFMPKNLQNSKSQIMEDSDEMSEENSNYEKVKHYEPLSLTPQQLQNRLHSLVNYSIYQKTKNQRVNISTLTESQQAPIVSTALNYGSKEGKNQVLPDYVSSHDNKEESDEINRFAVLLNSNPSKRKRLSQSSDPSFIRYKTIEDKQKAKVYKMINSLHHKNNGNRQRYITQTSTSQGSFVNILVQSNQKVDSLPKQLKKLKNRLSLLPILRKNSTLLCEDNNKKPLQLEQNKTLSINETQTNDLIMVTENFQNAYKNNSNAKLNSNNTSKRFGREQYLKEMKAILDKTKNEGYHVTQEQGSLRSSNLANSDCTMKKSIKLLVSKRRSKKIEYWPNYSQYCIPKKQQIKIERMKEKFYSFNPQKAGVVPEVRDVQEMIKQQINSQQIRINRDLIAVERDLLGHKFDYIFELEQQNYKRNVKELIKCKKQYFIQKQRQEIRANGIKRMKVIGIFGSPKVPVKKYQPDTYQQ